MNFSIFLFFLYLNYICEFIFAHKENLEFVTLFLRHGQRTPKEFLRLPTDEPGTSVKFENEPGELTKLGIQQIYELGKNLKQEYGNFIGQTYRPSELHAYSGTPNRIISSAQLLLAGFLPPVGDQIWNSNLLWQPIPVEVEPLIDLVSMNRNTPEDRKKYDQGIANNSAVAKFLTIKTGVEIPDWHTLINVVDNLMCRKFLGPELPTPKWADDEKWSKLLYHLYTEFINAFLKYSSGPWHMDRILAGIDDSINGNTKHKMIIYSVHSINMLTISEYLNLNITNYPEYGTYLAFEVYKSNENNMHYIKALLHPIINDTTIELPIGDCGQPCSYEKFSKFRSRWTNQQWKDYMGYSSVQQPATYYKSIGGGLMLLSIVLMSTVIILLWMCLRYRKRYEILTNTEKRHLLM